MRLMGGWVRLGVMLLGIAERIASLKGNNHCSLGRCEAYNNNP
jgi:hypothetical protein